jgi:tight adherence protein B
VPDIALTSKQIMMAGAAFGLVISVWMLIILFVSMRRLEKEKAVALRLGEINSSQDHIRVLRLWHEGEQVTTMVPVESALDQWKRRMQQIPRDAGWTTPIHSILLGLVGFTVLLVTLTVSITGNMISSLGIVLVVPVLFSIYTRYRITCQAAEFERQFADALQLLSRSLKAGHPLTGSFRLVAEEMRPPVSEIFAKFCQEQSLGLGLDESLQSAADSSTSSDLKLFATSVGIQIRTGGNLADMMDRLAAVIRERIKLSQHVRVISAQTQFSKRILLALPMVMLLVLSILNPAHLAPLFDTQLGHYMLIAGSIAMLLGWWTMNKLSQLEY